MTFPEYLLAGFSDSQMFRTGRRDITARSGDNITVRVVHLFQTKTCDHGGMLTCTIRALDCFGYRLSAGPKLVRSQLS